MQHVTKKYTLKTDAVVSVEMFVPIYHPTKPSYAYSPPLTYRREADQSTETYCTGTVFYTLQQSALATTGCL
jgi:hypothetical protein